MIANGSYAGTKLSDRRKKPFDENTDGTWTAQQIPTPGPGEEDDDKKKKKARKKSGGKAAKRGTKKAPRPARRDEANANLLQILTFEQ